MENYDYTNQINNTSKKKKKKTIIFISVGVVLLIVILMIGMPYYNRNKEAKEVFQDIENSIVNENYVQAYKDINKFKITYNFGNYPDKVEKKIKLLNDLAEQKLRDGCKILNSDDSEYYEETSKFFNDFLLDFSYYRDLSEINDLIKWIDDYKTQSESLIVEEGVLDWLISNKDILTIMEGYIDDAQYIHGLASDIINYEILASADELNDEWYNNSDYYYAMVDDIDEFSKSDIENTFFTTDEYSTFTRFIYAALLPAETAYNFMNGYNIDTDTTNLTKSSWEIYNDLEPMVIDLISNKKQLITNYNNNVISLREDVADTLQRIKTFTINDNNTL